MFNAFLIMAGVLAVGLLLFRMVQMSVTTSWGITEPGEGTGIGGSGSTTKTGETAILHTFTVPALAVDEANPVNFTAATVDALVLTTNTDVTIKVNSAGVPTDTIVLKANTPWVWTRDSGITFPLTGTAGAFTNFYISNPHATLEATVKVRGVA